MMTKSDNFFGGVSFKAFSPYRRNGFGLEHCIIGFLRSRC